MIPHSRFLIGGVFAALVAAIAAPGCAPQPAAPAEPEAGQAWLVDEADPAANAAVEKRLRSVVSKLDVSDIPLGDVIEYLRDVSTVNIHVRWEALRAANIDQTTPVNVKLLQVSVEKAMRTILDDVGGINPLEFIVDDGVVTISTCDDLSRNTITRVYDVRDLIARAVAFSKAGAGKRPPAPLAVAEGEGGALFGEAPMEQQWEPESISQQEAVDVLLDLIRTTIAPDSWRGGAAAGTIGSARHFAGKLIIQNTRPAHRRVSRLLAALREQTGTFPPPPAPRAKPERPAPREAEKTPKK